MRLFAQDPWPVLDRASAAYQRAQTLAADFVQIVVNPMLGEPDTTRGRLYQQRPSRFAMRFTQPSGDRIVADGRWLWLYTPSTTPGQVIRTRIPENGTTGPNLIGQFVERPRERYSARYVRADSTGVGWTDVIALTPRDSVLPYSGAVVWVGRADGLVRRLEITESSGQQRVVILRNLEENAAVAAREFRFTPPASVRVVDQ
jgi:outer membrane lipoprotein carrier protein